jgi:hypothetical protein
MARGGSGRQQHIRAGIKINSIFTFNWFSKESETPEAVVIPGTGASTKPALPAFQPQYRPAPLPVSHKEA